MGLLTFILFSFALPAFADTFVWKGNGLLHPERWAWSLNWDKREGSSSRDNPNSTSDIAYITTIGEYEIDIQHYGLKLSELLFQKHPEDAYRTSDWTIKLTTTEGGSLTFDLMELDRAATAAGVKGTVEFNCDAVCKDKIITHSDTTFTANNPITLGANSTITSYGNGLIKINELAGSYKATLYCETDNCIEISSYGATDFPSIVVAANSKSVSLGGGKIAGLEIKSNASATVTNDMIVDGDLTVDSDLTVSGDLRVTGKLTVTGSGKLNVSGNLSVNGATQNTGKINAAGNVSFDGGVSGADGTITMTGSDATLSGSGSSTIANFVYAPTTASGAVLTISSANTFTNFTCKAGGATLKINGAQEVTTLTLEGTSGSPLNITGSGSITLPSTQSSGKYLSVAHGGVKILPDGTSGSFYSAENSSFATTPSYGGDNNWLLLGDGMTFVWTGANGTDWDDAQNWNYNLVPGLNVPQSPADTRKYPVEIPDSPSGVSTNFPVAAAAYTVKSLQVGTSSGASLELSAAADITVTAASGALANHGTIVYSSSGRIKKGVAFINDATDGTVEFSSASGASDLSTPSAGYYNLTINNAAGTFTASGDLTVKNALAVSAGNASFNGATSAKTVAITTTGTLALGDGAGDSFTVTNGALELPATLGGLTLAGTISAAAPGITISKDATLAAATTFASDLTFGADCTVTGDMTFNANLKNNGTLKVVGKVTSTGTAATFDGSGSAEIQRFVYAPTSDGAVLTISSANTFTNFTCKYGGATIAVNDAQIINGTLTLKGDSESSMLSITGSASGAFNISSNQSGGQFLKVDRDLVSIGGKYFTAEDSEYNTSDEDLKYGLHKNWVLLNSAMEFVWTGNTDNNWRKPSNWKCNLIPGTPHGTGDSDDNVDTQNYAVTIPVVTSKPYPVVNDLEDYSVSDLTIDDAAANLTLSDTKNVAVSGTFANKGTIYYSGSGRITDGTSFINDASDTNKGKVEFTNASGATDLSDVSYFDLTINGSGDFISSGNLTVNNDLKAIAGNIWFNASDVQATGTKTIAKTITLSTTGSVSIGNNGKDEFSVTASGGTLEFPASLGDLEFCGTIKAPGGITLSKDATLSGNVTFDNDTTLGANVNLIVNNDHDIQTATTSKKLDCNGHSLTLTKTCLTNAGEVSNANIFFAEGNKVTGQQFTPFTSTYANVTINKEYDGTLTILKPLNVENLTITENGTATFTGKVTVSLAYSDAADAGKIAFNAGCAFTPAATFNTTGTLTLNNAANPATTCDFTNGLIHTAGTTALSDTLTATDAAITLGATTLAADTTIDAGTGNVTLGAISGAKELTFKNGGTLELTGTVAASKITMTGAAPTLTGNGTAIPNLLYAPTDTTGAGLTVSDGNTFTNFSCATGGATLKINDAQTVTTLALSGTDGNPLTITADDGHTGSIKITTNQHTGNFLNIDPDKVSINTGYYIADNSEFINSTPIYGQRSHWILMNKLMVFEWVGGDSAAWGTASNWNYNLVPGLASDSPHTTGGVSTLGYPVIISNTPTKTNMPATDAVAYSVGQLTIDDADSKLTLSAASVSIVKIDGVSDTADGTLTNKGTIIYSGAGRVTDGTNFINDDSETNKGTVEFTSADNATDLAAVEYYNLTISGSGTYTAAAALTVKNDLTQSAGTLKTNDGLTVTNALTVSGGSAFFNNGAGNASDTSAASASFTTSGTVSLGDTAGESGNDTFTTTAALSLSGQPAAGILKLGGTITAGGTGITLSHDATLAADTTFASSTKTDAAVTLSGAYTVTTSAALTTSAGVLTLENASLANTGTVTGGNIIFTETAAQTQTFTPNSPTSSTYENVTINKEHSGSLFVEEELKTKKLDITKNQRVEFKKYATVTTTYSDTINAGNIIFNKGCSFTPQATFNTKGTVTLNGTAAACDFTGGLVHTAGLTKLHASLTSSDAAITLAATTLDATTTINAGSGDVTIQGALETLDGNQALVSSGSGLLSFGGAVGATNALASITVEGETKVSGPSIKTAGLQLYKDKLTFATPAPGCAVTGTVQAASDVSTSAAITVTFNNDVWLYSSAAATLGGNSGSLSIAENLYFAGEPTKTATIASNVTAKNVLLLHGTVDIGASATLASSTGDVILLGPAYNIDDIKAADKWRSQVAGLFAYKPAAPFARKRAVSYTADFPGINPTVCPDGTTPISSSWSGAVTTSAGAKISAGQNFYANGLSSLGSGAWSLLLKDNNRQDSAFAEIYNSTITNCSANQKVAAAENVTANGCSNITTTRPVIVEAWTVYDDVVYISFKDSVGSDVVIENSCNEISAAAASVFNSKGVYASTYTDKDCLPAHTTNGKGDIAGGFYIKSGNKWKTDADGTTAGATESSNRAGDDTCDTIPYLNLPRALSTVYETLRDSSKNRISHYYTASPDTSAASSDFGQTFTAVADKCAPVLIQVLTGQELHETPNPADPASQRDCDAHNFVEFVYSEPVDISGGSTTVLDSDVNIRAAADLGDATNNSSGVTFAGLAKTSSGNVTAAVKSGSGSPHALYRNFSRAAGVLPQDQNARIRVSIAGFVDGTISAAGGSFKNWIGYISSAETPSGTITRIANANIKDRSAAKNSLDITSTEGHRLPDISVYNSNNELYGSWDVTPPSFAPIRINGSYKWEKPATDGSQEYEIVGASYSTGTLDAIELHWFDNEPTYAESRQWFSRVGWADASSPMEYGAVSSYAADVRGGSKQDSSAGNATSGGVRYCSLYDANNAFTYAIDGTSAFYDFTQNILAGAESSLFTYAGDTPGAATHTTGAEDGLYCKLTLDQTGYKLQTTFLLTFDSSKCFVTDLAGNRIQCGAIKIKSIDRTPPSFTMSAVPLGTKKMLIIFSKPLNTDSLILYTNPTDYTTVSALEYIPKSLELTNSSGTGIQIDQSVPARCLFKTKNATGMLVTLNQNAVLNDVTKGVYVTAKSGGYNYDPLSGIVTPMTYIQDAIGNSLVENTKHAFSDFAVNAIQPQYAYDNSLTDDGAATGYSLYQEGSWAVRDWNAEQQNYGTISANKEIIVQASLYDGTNDKSGGYNPAQSHIAFFSAAPTAGSVSTEINRNTEKSWRVWQPNYTSDVFGTLAPANNMSYVQIQGKANDSGVMFDIPKDASSSNWKNGDQVSFVFKLGNYTVDHFGDGTQQPLYAVRLKDSSDITSLDLWSFKIRTTTLQRGGVTILNNVIDLNSGENTVVQVDMKESGNLNVIVMTLDGNIIKYLRHGHTDAGTHYYNWNGTNNGGSKVARGLYFVRVIGPGIDETRKVMCVK